MLEHLRGAFAIEPQLVCALYRAHSNTGSLIVKDRFLIVRQFDYQCEHQSKTAISQTDFETIFGVFVMCLQRY